MKLLPSAAIALLLFSYRALLAFDPGSKSRLSEAERLLGDTSTSSPSMIFVLTAFFFLARARRLAPLVGRAGAPWLAMLALLPGSLLFGWACYVELDHLLVPSLSLVLLGGSLLVGGVPAFRVVLFPAAFLILALPMSTVLINQLSYSLQVGNASLSAWILSVVDPSVESLGDHVYFQNQIFSVIESCTGLRSVQTLVMASCVYVEVFRRKGRRAWLLVIAAPLVGLVVNELRILSIILNPYASVGWVHTLQGVVAISLGVLLLAAVDRALGRMLAHAAPAPARAAPALAPPTRRGWIALTALGAAFAAVSLWLPTWPAPDPSAPRLGHLSSSHEGWEVVNRLPVEVEFLGSTRFSDTLLREYERRAEGQQKSDERVELFIGFDDRLDGSNRALSPKTIVPGSGWEILEHGEGGLPGGDWYLVRSLQRVRLVYHRNYDMGSVPLELARSLFGLGRGPLRSAGRATVVRVSTVVAGTPDGMRDARLRLDRFVDSFAPLLAAYTEPRSG